MALQLKGNKQEPGRNEPCPCKSGLKFKNCHGCALKQEVCNRVANEKMVQLIRQEQRRKCIPIKVICPDCNQTPGIMENCMFCDGTGTVTEDRIKKWQAKDCLHCNGLGIVEGDGRAYACPHCQYSTKDQIKERYEKLTQGESDEEKES